MAHHSHLPSTPASTAPDRLQTAAYRRYLLGVLLLVLAFNYVDRLALGLLLQDIKADLALSDTQLGLLSGLAFAFFYSVMGIPIARWADRSDRISIIAVTTGLWSLAVAACGAAGSFAQMLLVRVGVGIGEAGCIPPAHSLIADHFDRTERPRAVGIYMLGQPLSFVFGYFLAGWLNQLYGWRWTFVALGVPGIILALLVRLTLRDPRSRGPRAKDGADAEIPFRQVVATLWRNRSFRHLLMCFAVIQFFGYGILQWKPAFFIRSYGLDTATVGTWFAAIYGIGGLLGTYLGGELATRYAAGRERNQLLGIAAAFAFFAVVSTCVYLAPTLHLALALLALATIGVAGITGPLFATVQTLVTPRMRAMSIAVIYLFANLIGMGLGPLAAGAISDALRPFYGEESLRYALMALSPGYLWASFHLWRASRTISGDLMAAAEPAVVATPTADRTDAP
jgi:predicted MFS family arabinose efflux permease